MNKSGVVFGITEDFLRGKLVCLILWEKFSWGATLVIFRDMTENLENIFYHNRENKPAKKYYFRRKVDI